MFVKKWVSACKKNELCLGKMSERFKELVLKTSVSKETVGSNPTLSATYDKSFWRNTQAGEEAPLLRV